MSAILWRLCVGVVTFAIGLFALNYLVQRLVIAALLLLTLAACDGRGFPKDYRLPAYQGVDYWLSPPSPL